jgi:hypothetical protein
VTNLGLGPWLSSDDVHRAVRQEPSMPQHFATQNTDLINSLNHATWVCSRVLASQSDNLRHRLESRDLILVS